jgi:GNAT superfamily N-acetyltransferase
MRFYEIARIPQGDFGDKGTLAPLATRPKTKPLPGGSGYTYAVNKKDPEFMEIMIFDGDTLAAELDLGATLDPLKTWQVETVATDPDYRGQGLGKALYGIALNILKLTLEAGDTQTKHGQAMWLMLNSIPGVEVLGYTMEPTSEYRPRPGDDVVDQNERWTRFTFPVEPGRRSMRSTRRGTGVYSSARTTMIARWMDAAKKLKEALHFVRPGELRGSYSDQQMLQMGFRRAKNGVWYIDQRRWDALLQRGQLREINANDELTVSQQIEDYFFKRGYQFAGEGRDQMAFVSPRNTVVKVLGIGDPEREKIVKDYVAFFVRNQRNPYYPRIYNTGEFTLNGETYFVYEMEYLDYVANEEATLEYLEDLMNAAARGYADAYQQNRPMPPELDEDEIQGLLMATEDLIDALGGYAPLDLSNIENLRRRSNGHLVIMDPFSL